MRAFNLGRYLAYRLPLMLALALLSLALWTAIRPAIELSASATTAPGARGWRLRAAEFLSRAHGVWISADSVSFLPLDREPAWYEGFHYLPVVFAAIPDRPLVAVPLETTLPDLFYAEVAMNRAGQPVDSRRFTNVTRTPAAAETVLAVRETKVVLASSLRDSVGLIQILDFSGDNTERAAADRGVPFLFDLITGLDNLQETGRWGGVGWTEYALASPAARLTGQQVDGVLQLQIDATRVVMDLDSATVASAAILDPLPRRRRGIDHPGNWAANWLRNFDWMGADRVALLEYLAFHLRDRLNRLFAGDGSGYANSIRSSAGPPGTTPRFVEPSDGEWPPPRLATLPGLEPIPGEGRWMVSGPDWLPRLDGAPEAFLQSFVRVDPDRPWVWALAVAMDLRQIELRYQQGAEHPLSTTGRRGTGEIPRDPETLNRLTAAFAGGFKTTHGAYGSIADGVTFLEPVAGAATLAWPSDGPLRFGTWTAELDARRLLGLRQNLPPLVADGEVRPTERWFWPGGGGRELVTERSGVCRHGSGTLIYFWGESLTSTTLGRAMQAAGCDYGMHLDMNPHLAGFEFYRLRDLDSGEWDIARPTREMAFDWGRFLQTETKDFFYVLRRRTFAETLPPVAETAWEAVGMPATAEGFLPVAARISVDAAEVRIIALDTSMLAATFAFGTAEPPPALGAGYRPRPRLPVADPVVALELDAVQTEAPRGLRLDGESFFGDAGQGVWLTFPPGAVAVINDGADAATRIELTSIDNPAAQRGVCAAIAHLAEPRALLLAWGPTPDLRERLAEIGASPIGLLGCGRYLPRIESLEDHEGGWEARDLITGDSRVLSSLQGERTRILFEPLEREPVLGRIEDLRPPVPLNH